MYYIDPDIAESNINANERAIIEKYGFDVRQDGTHFAVLDTVIRKANRGKGGRHTGGNISALLAAAVSEHKAHEKNAGAPSDKKTNKTKVNGNGSAPEVDPTLSTDAPFDPVLETVDPVSDDEGALADDLDVVEALEKEVIASDDEPTTLNVENKSTYDDTSDDEDRASDVEVVIPVKTKRVKKVVVKKVRQEGKYMRAVRMIMANRDIAAADLGEELGSSPHYASYLIQIVLGTIKVYNEQNSGK